MSGDPVRRARAAAIGDMGVGRGLEIGPLDAPIAPRDLYDVRYVDVVDTDSLREKYGDDPNVTNDEIVDVDFCLVDGNGAIRPLAQAVSRDAPYAWVVASHVIEHVPDLIAWLADIAEILVDNGQLLLMIPDRRFSFDALRPQTTVGQLLQAHTQGDMVPSERAVFDHFRSYVSVPSTDLWAGKPASDYPREFDLEVATAMRRRSVESGEYIDSHVWLFTPTDFVDQIVELGTLGKCDFVIDRITATGVNELEFYAALRRIPRGLDARAVRDEHSAGIRAFMDAPTVDGSAPAEEGDLAADPVGGRPPVHELSDLEARIIETKRWIMATARGLRSRR
jgi:hypothetical protein